MKIRKIVSLLLALVFVVSLVPVLPVTADAADKLDTPIVQLNGKTVIWRPVDNAQSYEIEMIYKLEGAGEAMAVRTLVSVSEDGTVKDAMAYVENSSTPTDVQSRLQYVDFINSYV